ncbi:recombinase family protein [Microbacterium paludicola]|nr:recombinase family protein [Microbacterium paludicola]
MEDPTAYELVVLNDGDEHAPELSQAWAVIRKRFARDTLTTDELVEATGLQRRAVKGLLYFGKKHRKVWGRMVRRPVEVSPAAFVMSMVRGRTAYRQGPPAAMSSEAAAWAVLAAALEQASSGLGLDAQRDTIQRYTDAHGWDVLWHEDASLSAKSLARPQLQGALDRLDTSPTRSDVDGIVVAKVDRLSRSVADFARVLELARSHGWALVAIDLGVDTSTPTGELVANVMMSVAQWERRVIGERTSAAMQAAKRQGRHMRRVSVLPEATGDRPLALRRTHTLADTAAALNTEGHTTATGLPWTINGVAKVQRRLANRLSVAA